MTMQEAKLKEFEDYYGKIDFCALWQIPEDTERIIQAISEDRLFQIYVKDKVLYITSEFDPYNIGLGFYRAKRRYKDIKNGETLKISLQ